MEEAVLAPVSPEIMDSDALQRRREQVLRDEAHAFEMPYVDVGQQVVFYSQGNVHPSSAQIGHVFEKGTKTIGVYLMGSQQRTAVRHVADPRLKLEPQLREGGLWDYTPEHKRRAQELKELRDQLAVSLDRVEALEKQVEKLTKKNTKAE